MLHPFLVFDVLFDHFQGSAANRRDEIRVRPEGRQPRLEPGVFLAQQPRRPTFDSTDQAMDTVLWIDFPQEVDMFRHDFQFNKLGTAFSTYVLDNLFKSDVNPADQHGTAVLGTPYDVILARIDHVII